jgi:CheY-like chemotaxis protein
VTIQAEPTPASGHGVFPMHEPPRILVVDDDAQSREFIKRTLVAMGYEADCAADGIEALQLEEVQEYAVVFTDLLMPGLNGVGLARELLSRDPDRRIVIYTGWNDHPLLASAFSQFDTALYLMKPFTSEDIRRVAAEALEQP